MGSSELGHQLLAPGVLKHFHRHPTAAKQVFLAAVFTDHYAWKTIQENGAAAHGTR